MRVTIEYDSSDDILVSREQLGEKLGISKRQVELLENQGVLEPVRVGTRVIRYHWPTTLARLQMNHPPTTRRL